MNMFEETQLHMPVSASTRIQTIQTLQQSDDIILAMQQVLDDYNSYLNTCALSCSALTPLNVKQLQLLTMGATDNSLPGITAFICHFLANGNTELLTLSEYGMLLTMLNMMHMMLDERKEYI